MRDHTKLRAFELADEVAVLVYRVTAGFPREELYGLTSQMRRAAVSVPSNIIEGCARDNRADYLRFLYIVSVQKRGFLFKIKACEKFYRRHIVDIPRIKF